MEKLTACRLKKVVREELQETVYGARHQGVQTGRGAMKPENVFHQFKNHLEDNYREVAPNIYEVDGIYLKPGTRQVRAYTSVPDGSEYHDGFVSMDNYPHAKVGAFQGRGTANQETLKFRSISQFADEAIDILKQKMRESVTEDIGWDNLPDGWDEDSVESFARSLTDKTKDDSEGFFRACMDEVEDKFDDPEAFCASLKDEYLDTTDWRGKDESASKPKNMKLTETKLRRIVREEMQRLAEAGRIGDSAGQIEQEFHRFFANNGLQVDPEMYEYEDLFFHLDRMGGMALFVNVFRDQYDSESVANAKIEGGKVRMTDGGMPKGAYDELKYRGPKPVVKALVSRAESPPMEFGRGR